MYQVKKETLPINENDYRFVAARSVEITATNYRSILIFQENKVKTHETFNG